MAGLWNWLQKRLHARPAATPPGSPMDNYGVFRGLPAEIRHLILVAAFGGQTMHIDLRTDSLYGHRRRGAKRRRILNSERAACERHETHETPTTPKTPKTHKTRQTDPTTQWFSCVCRRLDEADDSRDGYYRASHAEDCCVAQPPCTCKPAWKTGSQPVKAPLGICVWLLSCRMAYTDGMHVVFLTNTIVISNMLMLMHTNLPRLLLPQRLSSVKSLELLWNFEARREAPGMPLVEPLQPLWDDARCRDTVLHDLCAGLPVQFPGLRRLHISLLNYHPPGDFDNKDAMLRHEKLVLDPIEDMLRVLGPGRDYSVTVHVRSWSSLKRSCTPRDDLQPRQVMGDWIGRFWKWIGPEENMGYWVCYELPYRWQ